MYGGDADDVPLHPAGGPFLEEQEVEAARDRRRRNKPTTWTDTLLALNLVGTLALAAMMVTWFMYYSENHDLNHKVNELLAEQQTQLVTEFFQLKVLQALYGPDVIWPPLDPDNPVLSPSPSPSPGARSEPDPVAGAQNLEEVKRRNAFERGLLMPRISIGSDLVSIYDKMGVVENTTNTTLDLTVPFIVTTENSLQRIEEDGCGGDCEADVMDWPMWGKSWDNHVFVDYDDASYIDVDNVEFLTGNCVMEYFSDSGGAANAQPTLRGDFVLFSSATSGEVWAYNQFTCNLVWRRSVTEIFAYDLDLDDTSLDIDTEFSLIPARGTVTLYRRYGGQELAIIAAPSDRGLCVVNAVIGCPQISTYVIGLDLYTGEVVDYIRTSDTDSLEGFMAEHYASPTIYDGNMYIGTTMTVNPYDMFGAPCTFIGSFMKIYLESFNIEWRTYTMPLNDEWCGVGVRSVPAVDPEAGLVYFGTEPAYFTPEDANDCFETYVNIGDPEVWSAAVKFCHTEMMAAYMHPLPTDSLVAVNLYNGDIVWTFTPGGLEVYNSVCDDYGPNERDWGEFGETDNLGCPGFNTPDWGFGSTVVLVTQHDADPITYVVAGHRAGVVHAVAGDSGNRIWSIDLGEGGKDAGVEWGGSYSPETALYYVVNTGGQTQDQYGDYFNTYSTVGQDVEVCRGSTMHAIDVIGGVVVWESVDAIAEMTYDDTFPPDCQAGLPTDAVSTEVFKNAWTFVNAAGVDVPRGATAAFGIPCNKTFVSGPHDLPELALIYGVNAISNGIIAFGSLTGNIYLHDTVTGDCLETVSCPYGSIYGGVTFSEYQMFVQCGYSLHGVDGGVTVSFIVD